MCKATTSSNKYRDGQAGSKVVAREERDEKMVKTVPVDANADDTVEYCKKCACAYIIFSKIRI